MGDLYLMLVVHIVPDVADWISNDLLNEDLLLIQGIIQ